MPKSAAWLRRFTPSAFLKSALVGMQPQFRHTPPGRSSSTVATERPSWAQRMAATEPPGPGPTTATSTLCVAIALDQQAQRLLEEPLDVLQEPGTHRAVHHAVIARDRQHHAPPDAEPRAAPHRHAPDRSDREDGALGRVDDGRELGDVEHAEVRDGERRPRQLRRAELAVARPPARARHLS